jgi:hypothetical protein
MKNTLRTLLALCLTLPAAFAEQVINYPEDKPIFSISFPDDWKIKAGESLSASSKDELVNMELIALEAEALDGALDIAKESLSEEMKGIKWDDEVSEGELNGVNAKFLNGKVTIEDVKMAINCAIFAPKGQKEFFMLFNIIPMEALEQHGEDVSKILNSIEGK